MSPRSKARQTMKIRGEKLRNSYLLYVGPSLLTGKEIFAVVTGFVRPSQNGKTGDLLQVWFIAVDGHPMDLVNNGLDCSVCGNCPFTKCNNEGTRLCYVELNTVFSIWRAFHCGSYTMLPTFDLFDGWEVRLGAYGDPASVPEDYLRPILHVAEFATSYTHLWKHFPALSDFSMASVVTPSEYHAAKRLGFNTFRVRPSGDSSLYKREIVCPAQSRGLTCKECGLCAVRGADVAIDVHGVGHIVNGFNDRYGYLVTG